MEKSLVVFIFLCSALLEVHCLECYVCDNCPKVKLDQIQTCGPTTISEPSTTMPTITESPTTTTVAAKLSSSTSTTLKPTTTKTTSQATTIPTKITTEDTTTSVKTTEATPATTTATTKVTTTSTTETTPSSTEFTIPTAIFSAAAMEPINTPTMSPVEDIIISSGTIISTSSLNSATTEPPTITTPAEASITTEPMTLSTIINNATLSSTTTFTERAITLNEEEEEFLSLLSEPVISSVTTTESYTADTSVSLISNRPTAVTVPIETFSATEPTILSFSTILTSAKQNAEPIIQNIPTLPTLTGGSIATFATESPTKIPIISATNYPESTVNNKTPNNQTNGAYNLRRTRSSSEGCACKDQQKCDCWTRERSKRYALRGLGLSKDGVKYVCFVDKYRINETEVVKRGCAIKEEEKATCRKLGFGANCKICDTNQCNSATIMRSSVLLMLTLYLTLQ